MVRDYQVIIKKYIHSRKKPYYFILVYRVFWSMIYQKIGSIYDNVHCRVKFLKKKYWNRGVFSDKRDYSWAKLTENPDSIKEITYNRCNFPCQYSSRFRRKIFGKIMVFIIFSVNVRSRLEFRFCHVFFDKWWTCTE